MYERFYGVGERPFTLLPDPDFLFLGDKHQTALDMLEMAISSHSGFCVVSGEIGAGKTTLIREVLNRLDDSVRVGLVSNTHPSFGELMQWTMAAYGLPCGSSDKLELHKQFIDFVIQQYAENRHTLLIIDEAQNLSLSSLEELRMLSNVNSEKDLVLQVILVGQQQLREKLADPALQQLAQRVELDYHLEGLSESEVRAYIQHRLRRAGGNPELFTDAACSAVYQESAGIPRRVNRLCELCLVYGCAEERLSIDAELVSRVSEDQRKGRLLSEQEVASQESSQTSSRIDAAPAGKEVPASESAVHDDPGQAERPVTGGSAASQDIVNEMSSVFLAKQDRGNSSSAEASPPADTVTELHKLVVNAEKQQQASKGERSALWLLVGIAAMVGITGWMTRDLWMGDGLISAESGPVAKFVHTLIQRDHGEAIESVSVEATADPVPGKAELERKAELQRKAERLARLQEEARQLEAEEARQLELERKAELQRKAERLARLQEEARLLEEEEARQLELEHEAELKRKAELQREAELQRKAELKLERKAELKRKAELERKAELQRKAERQRKAELQRQADLESKAERRRKAELQLKVQQERKAERRRKAELQRQAELERRAERQREAERRRKVERQARLEQEARQLEAEEARQLELERKAELQRKAERLTRLQEEARQLEEEETRQLELEHRARQARQDAAEAGKVVNQVTAVSP